MSETCSFRDKKETYKFSIGNKKGKIIIWGNNFANGFTGCVYNSEINNYWVFDCIIMKDKGFIFDWKRDCNFSYKGTYDSAFEFKRACTKKIKKIAKRHAEKYYIPTIYHFPQLSDMYL